MSAQPFRLARRPHRSGAAVVVHLRWARLRRIRWRHAGLGPARQRRPSRGAELQVSPPARHLHRRSRRAERARQPAQRGSARTERHGDDRRVVRRARGTEPEAMAVARLRPDARDRPLLHEFCGRVLLQDLHGSDPWRVDVLRENRPEGGGLRRSAAGTGSQFLRKGHAFCDVLVVGGGASGLAAALAAGRRGARVVLAEDGAGLGGSLLSRPVGGETNSWLGAIVGELKSLPNVRTMKRTTVFGAYDHREFGLLERVGDHLPVPHPANPASATGSCERDRSSSRPACSSGRSSSATTICPASCLRRRPVLMPIAMPWFPAARRSSSPTMTPPTTRPSILPQRDPSASSTPGTRSPPASKAR